MHYSNLVLIEKPDEITKESIEEAVAGMMGESADWWDWYQIGGRWTGHFDGYDAEADSANLENCKYCNATGKRKDMECANGCNGCGGTGQAKKWPTQWGFREGDVIPVEELTDAHCAVHRVVCSYGVFSSERYIPWEEDLDKKFQKTDLPPLAWLKDSHAGYLAVIVDNHN